MSMKDSQFNISLPSMPQPVAAGLQTYVNALIEHGAVEGRLGDQYLIPELEPALEIIHKVLAGGELRVSIEVVREPDAEVLAQFEEKRRDAERDANELNKAVGVLYAMG